MLHTSLRVIHQTDRFTVTKFAEKFDDDSGRIALVVERLSPSHKTTGVRAFVGDQADMLLSSMAKNAKATFLPGREYTTDDILATYF